MDNIGKRFYLALVLIVLMSCKEQAKKKEPAVITQNNKMEYYNERYRPQFHFSPEEKWMNDPNGLVYHKGVYHLFYQYYPEDIVWGPMHWGHATSKDLVVWEHRPIALFPDAHGYIFSGSAVVDVYNTSKLGSDEAPPLVAIFTYHDAVAKKEGKERYETQGVAFSLDNGETWTKYEGNPVIGNPGERDFRDPKVFWNEKTKAWSMLLVAGDHLQIWGSDNLLEWKKVSEFGREQGAHGGVWECPDMFKLVVDETGEEKWVLLISINPGAPNGGSGTQYFVGDFDGETFTSDQKNVRWVDWGADNYAGVTYNNTPNNDRIFIGWMSNWNYATKTPTKKWRSAMTLPRKLSLRKIRGNYELINYPLKNLNDLLKSKQEANIVLQAGAEEAISFDNFNQAEIRFMTNAKDFNLTFKNQTNERLILAMDGVKEQFLVDRSQSGVTNFDKNFGGLQQMPIINLPEGQFEVRLFVDRSSIEIFINKGQYVMTSQLFPTENYTDLSIKNTGNTQLSLNDFKISEVKDVW
ncbi:glycoside hydrolase family 32 protein [uncultured Kriegella sp.]|uniref:glycoside hydrolase family 32 protein n=1 Tax=uncultured Kriegella sp. TaxID=1798910 RepID=UPI0030DC49D4|tara:strand:+ start:147023 stop:148591 length:1569 start_codon:yes stop_codon:yes gene_type:complete